MHDLTFEACLTHLRRRLAQPLPGQAAQFRMAPRYRQDAELADVRGKPCREAAVLALLHPLADDAPALVLTVRPPDMKHHGGQIAFPGGRREADEARETTALREAEEEVGLPQDQVDLLGPLTPLYIPPSNFCVYPFVGAVEQHPDLYPADEEVAEILHVPLARLLAPTTHREEPWTLRGREVVVPYFSIAEHKVWGATAMMLAELLALFEGWGMRREG